MSKHNDTQTGTWLDPLTDRRVKKAWYNMKDRINQPRHPGQDRYQELGITICKEWLDSFERFALDMGPRPPGSLLDRIDNAKGYFKNNCRWANASQSSKNRDFTQGNWGNRLDQEQKDRIVFLKVQCKWKHLDIAREVGCSARTVTNVLRGSIGGTQGPRRVIG